MNKLIISLIVILQGTFCFSQGEYPSSVDFDYNLFNRKGLPEVFDLRNFDRLSKMKVQPAGGCWASSAVASVESFRKSAGIQDAIFSDIHLKLFHGFDSARSTSGNHYMATAYFSRGNGPLIKNPETDSIYNPQPEIYSYITDVRYLPNNPSIVKQVIMDYGAVFSMMYFRRQYIDSTSFVFYTPYEKINHVVILIGWNDTLKTKNGEGVWIAQNSLGADFGDRGFFYIPYQDPNILNHNAVWPKWMDYNKDVKLYYYDTLGSYYSYGFRDTICYGLVKFEAEEDIQLSKIGTSVNFGFSKIYGEVFQKFDTASKELSGYLGNIDSIICRFPGYYTLDLNQDINIRKGEDFYIMMRYVTPNDTLPLPIETFIENYSDPHIIQGKCWINPNYEKWPATWYECGPGSKYTTLNFDLCIKVYCLIKNQ